MSGDSCSLCRFFEPSRSVTDRRRPSRPRPAGQRVVSGIIETRYRIAQLSVRLDRSLLAGGAVDETAAAFDEVLRTIFDTAR